ncbi:hypothetical protein FLK61_34060 [Paenalkalicoccus suaedae]|uniref:Uncharacterized protein n=1 Tax=Paenalkalicoccus suaedae TaxID=2592382 RepID=A0A859FAK2_9BACI|nr:hypothetical protein [Paenalkalicoccus suaedae]QKS70269.1 hypothetical protein FLK61_26270 [Paenalkalicoccus suaedae]QKS71706.1 hypothetical protein FLK61_34060 [Paenalkalicoccus suaedae]
MSLTYRGCKSMIDRRSYASVEDMQQKLDIFLLNSRISQDEYNELTESLNNA